MISKVSIRNFKCLRDVSVDLERFTVFVGANGSGKTSVLQALDLLCRTFQTNADMDNEFRSHRTFGTTEPVELSCLSEAIHYRYRTKAQPQPNQHGQKWGGDGVAFAPAADPENWKQWQPNHGMSRKRCGCGWTPVPCGNLGIKGLTPEACRRTGRGCTPRRPA